MNSLSYNAYVVSRRLALNMGLRLHSPFVPSSEYTGQLSFFTDMGLWYIGILPPDPLPVRLFAVVTFKPVTTKRAKNVLYFTMNELQGDKQLDEIFCMHFIAKPEEKAALQARCSDLRMLQHIHVSDLGARMINAKPGDVVRIHRKGPNGERATIPCYRFVC